MTNKEKYLSISKDDSVLLEQVKYRIENREMLREKQNKEILLLLDKQFTAPKKGPYYNCKKIPRKIKKKWNKIATNKLLTVNQRLWEILGQENPKYISFLIRQNCNS